MSEITCPVCLGDNTIPEGLAEHISFAACINCAAEWDERERQPTARIAWEHFKAGMDAAGNLVKQDRNGHLVLVSVATGQANAEICEDISPALNCNHEQPYIAGACDTYQQVTGTFSPGAHPGSYNGQDAKNDMLVSDGYIVRRLTPVECERLQGFPDGWTKHGADGKLISDSKRYSAIGNSVAIPCVDYIMQGLAHQGGLFEECGR